MVLEIDLHSFPPFLSNSYDPSFMKIMDRIVSKEKLNMYMAIEKLILQKNRSYIPKDILNEIKEGKIEMNHMNVLLFLMENLILDYRRRNPIP